MGEEVEYASLQISSSSQVLTLADSGGPSTSDPAPPMEQTPIQSCCRMVSLSAFPLCILDPSSRLIGSACHTGPMATAENANKVPVVLESPVGSVLLRFDQHRDGSLQPVWEDPDATPSRCVERLLLEESAAKRRRHEAAGPAGPVESDRERIEFLREAQETALEGVQRATTAAQLLSVSGGSGGAEEAETQFLVLQSAVPRPLDFSQVMRHASEVDEAAEAHRQELLDIANARLTNKALQQLAEMEAALSFLGERWHLHCVAGQYAIELRLGRFSVTCCALGLGFSTSCRDGHARNGGGKTMRTTT